MRPILYAVPIGIAAGGASAFFLVLLERASAFFEQDPRLLFLLPVFAALTAWLYLKFGGTAGKGTDLVLDRAAEPGPDIPLAMAPLVLVGTVLTHLGGGSAGREGTAVQMGGSLADALGRGLSREERCQTIVAGIAGGFGAVFGTPLAGAAFALEAPRPLPTKGLWYGSLWRGPLLPALLAAWIAHLTCLNLGVTHTDYRSLIGERILFSLPTLLLAIGVGIAAGGASRAFVLSIHGAKRLYGKVADPVVRAAVGGIAVVTVTLVLGTRAYNGLSIPLLVAAFDEPAQAWIFAGKLGLTALTLGAGMKGGEVTPLFVIGGTLGSAIAGMAGLDPAAGAALGFCAVFSGAARTPIACVLMSLELFGTALLLPSAVACAVSFLVAGREGIYGRGA